MPQRQALAVFEQHQVFGRVHRNVAVRADAPGTLLVLPGLEFKNAVAQIGLGAGAQTGHGTRGRSPLVFVRVHVRGVHQAPACIDWRMVQQPGHRALP